MQDAAVTHAEIVPILLSVIGFLLIALVSLYVKSVEKRVKDLEKCLNKGDFTFASLIDAVNELSINLYEVAVGVNILLGDAGKTTISIEKPKAIKVART